MRIFHIDDREICRLVSTAIRERLLKEGFVPGMSERADAPESSFYFPVSLDLAGVVTVSRDPDGSWKITQEVDMALAERTRAADQAFGIAIADRERPRRLSCR